MSKQNIKYNSLSAYLIVFCLYTALTIILTYPWITEFNTHKLGDDIDGSMLIWNLWWVKKALTSLNTSLLFSDYIFYPIGSSLTFHTFTLLNGLIAFLFLIKSFEEEKSKYLNIFLASLFLVFNALMCEIYGLFAAIFTLGYLIYYLIEKKDYHARKSGLMKS